MDLNVGKMRVTSNLGGRAIFMDHRCADTIYLGGWDTVCLATGSVALIISEMEALNPAIVYYARMVNSHVPGALLIA